MVGVFVGGGTGVVDTDDALAACDDEDIECSAGQARLGLQARVYFREQARLQPWVGASLGYEWFAFSAKSELYEDSATVQAKGMVPLQLSAGLEVWTSPRHNVDVVASYSFGRFSKVELNDSIDGTTEFAGAAHHWVMLAAAFNVML